MDTNRDGREPFTAQASILLISEPQTVWDWLDAPGARVLLDERHLKSFHVPGTPEVGAGHQLCSFRLSESGSLDVTVYETVEESEPFRSVNKILNTDVPYLEGLTLAVVPGGCSLALTLATRIPAGSARTVGKQLQAHLEEHARKIKALVETGRQP